MPNDHIKSEISAYLAGGLPEGRNRQIDAHLSVCEKCRHAVSKARAKQARNKREALKKASSDPLPNLFLARQGKDVGVDKSTSKSPWAVLAGLALLGGAYGIYHHFSPGTHMAEMPAVTSDPSLVEISSAPVVSSPSVSAKMPTHQPVDKPVAPAAPPTAAAVPPTPVPPHPPITLDVKQEWSGTDSGIKVFRVNIIRNTESLEKVWVDMQNKEPLPPVDFSKQVVLSIFGGERPAGTTIQLGKLLERADDVVIPYKFVSAGVAVSSVTLQAPSGSYPYLLTLVSRLEKKIRLTQKEENP